MVTSSLRCSSPPTRPLHNRRTSACASIHYPLVGFSRLQGSAYPYTGWDPVPSWVLPLSAPSLSDMQNRLPDLLLSVPRFLQPHDRNDVRNNLQVCSTLLALLGFGLQRTKPDRSGAVPSPWLLRRYSALRGFLPDDACGSRPPDHRAFTRRRSHTTRPLVVLKRLAATVDLNRPWSVAPEQARLFFARRFHPPGASAPLLTLAPSGFSTPAALGDEALPLAGLLPP